MAIHSDAPLDTLTGTLDEGADAFMNLWKDDAQDEPSDTIEGDEAEDKAPEAEPSEDTDETEETSDEESSEDDGVDEDDDAEEDQETDEDESDDKDRKVLKDTDVVKIKVDGAELAVPVEKLKRLYGQEASLTRKSQEVALKRKEVDTNGAAVVAANEALLNRAKERYAPYAAIDWLVASKELEASELKVLRDEATKAYNDVQFFDKELTGFMENVQRQRHNDLVSEAKSTFEELSDPVKGIKGFNQKTYDDMRTFAITQGIPEDFINNTVSAPVLRVLHKAMLHDRGSKVVTTTTTKGPKKIIKSRSNPESTRKAFQSNDKGKAMSRLKSEGSVDAATDAFLASFSDN